jgi:uncharacterized membrane protein
VSDTATDLLHASQHLFNWFCHRNPARSYPLADGTVLLCARCTGLYLGAFAGALSSILWSLRRGWPTSRAAVPILLAGILATPAEVLGEIGGSWRGGNAVRLILGGLTGTSLACAIIGAMGGGAAALSGGGRRWLPAIPLFLDGVLLPMAFAPHRWGNVGTMVAGVVLLLGFFTLTGGPAALLVVRVRRYFSRSALSEGSSP